MSAVPGGDCTDYTRRNFHKGGHLSQQGLTELNRRGAAALNWESVGHARSDGAEVDSHKMLMGLNFYGNYFKAMGQGGPVIGHEYLEILDRERPSITWNSDAAEHLATVKDKQDSTKRHLLVRHLSGKC